MKSNKKELWLTNISKRDISITDLGVVIRSMTSINLLDDKHYRLQESSVKQSIESGTIYKKRNVLFVRKVAPEIKKPHRIEVSKDNVMKPKRSSVEISQEKFEELDLKDEDYANIEAELLEEDLK